METSISRWSYCWLRSYAAPTLLVLFAGIFGACCAPAPNRWLHWFLVGNILFPCAVHTMIFGHSRYHLPIIPLVCVFAGAAIVGQREIWSRRHSWAFALAGSISVILVLGWVREFVFVDYGLLAS